MPPTKRPPGKSRKPEVRTQKPTTGDVLFWPLLALLATTLIAYYPAWHGGILWDDNRHLTTPELSSADGLRRIWFDVGATPQYYPVVHTAFWILNLIFGNNTFGYHLVSIGLHALSAYLLAVILRKLDVPGAWLAAVIFALHPVHVESVAWMAELKNTLSGVFSLAAVLAYLRFDATRRARPYALALVFFALALLTKTVTAMLPAALVVLLWWRRGAIAWRRDIVPLVPMFAGAAAAGLTTAWLERVQVGAEGLEFHFSFLERLLIAGRAVWFYLGTLVWPLNLAFIYPRWEISAAVWWQYLFPIGAAALFAVCWSMRTRTRAPFAALAIFVLLLFPALGFFNAFPFRYSFVANHFQYLASTAVIALFAAAVIAAGRASARPYVFLIPVGLGALTFAESRQYKDVDTLFRETLARNPSCWMCHVNIGVAELESPGSDPAGTIAHFEAALRIVPDNFEAHHNLGTALQRQGRFAEAIVHYRSAIRARPAAAGAHEGLATALAATGDTDEAITEFEQAIGLKSESPTARNNLGLLLLSRGRTADALPLLLEAVRLQPDYALAHRNLADALQRVGRSNDAVEEFRAALAYERSPAAAEIANDLGVLLVRLGRLPEAIVAFEDALRVNPDFAPARANLARAKGK
jgi:protein O-mannosyl-transferase